MGHPPRGADVLVAVRTIFESTGDVASAVRWLAGPESSWVTGQCFAIDGGHTLRRGPRTETLVETFFGPEAVAFVRPR